MTDMDDRGPAEHGGHEGADNGSITRRTAIISGAVAIGGVVIWTPESLALPSRKMRSAQKDIDAIIKIVRSSKVSSSLRAKTLPDLLQVKKAIDSQARAEAASKSRAVRARSAQAGIPPSLCAILQAIRNAYAASPAAGVLVPLMDRLLLTFSCSPPPGTGM